MSGGFGLNCVANYWYLGQLKDEDINLYVEPISNDAGTSIGAALFAHHAINEDKKVESAVHLEAAMLLYDKVHPLMVQDRLNAFLARKDRFVDEY